MFNLFKKKGEVAGGPGGPGVGDEAVQILLPCISARE
jgi:hypothetical protein